MKTELLQNASRDCGVGSPLDWVKSGFFASSAVMPNAHSVSEAEGVGVLQASNGIRTDVLNCSV